MFTARAAGLWVRLKEAHWKPFRSALRQDSAMGLTGREVPLHRVAVGSWCACALGVPWLEGVSEAVVLWSSSVP